MLTQFMQQSMYDVFIPSDGGLDPFGFWFEYLIFYLFGFLYHKTYIKIFLNLPFQNHNYYIVSK